LSNIETIFQDQTAINGDLNAAKGTTFGGEAMRTANGACEDLISNAAVLDSDPVPPGFTSQMSTELHEAMTDDIIGGEDCTSGIIDTNGPEIDSSASQFQHASTILNQLSIQLGA
jgi:hypothetical protein